MPTDQQIIHGLRSRVDELQTALTALVNAVSDTGMLSEKERWYEAELTQARAVLATHP